MRVEDCLRLYWGWPRLYNTWSAKYGRWDEKPDPIERDAAVGLIEARVPAGFRQCYAEGGNNCAKRDIIIYETDAKDCSAGDMSCVVERSKAAVLIVLQRLREVGAHPVLWYNGGHSIYIAVRVFPVDVGKYVVKRRWIALAARLGMDTHLLQSPNAFRNPCTPHPKSKKLGQWLDEELDPIPEPRIPTWPDWNIAFFEPVEGNVKTEGDSVKSKDCDKMNVPADPKLLLETLKSLWPAAAGSSGRAGLHHRLLAALASVAARRCVDVTGVVKELLEWSYEAKIDKRREVKEHRRTVRWFYTREKRYGLKTLLTVVEEAARRAGQDPQAVADAILQSLGGSSKEKSAREERQSAGVEGAEQQAAAGGP